MMIAPLLRLFPADLRITLADVGSAGGVQRRWAPARRIVEAMLFEPREGGEVRRDGADTIYPIALGEAPGRATLNVTSLANMSSTLVPNAALLSTFRKKGPHVEVVDRIDFPVDTLDAIAARDGRHVDAIKVDTQGSELAILKGASRSLADTVLLAEAEVSFLERYSGQPLAADVLAHMKASGFGLIELHRTKRYRALNRSSVTNVGLGGGQRAGRIAYADAIFFIEEERLLPRLAALPSGEAEMVALKAIVALCVYGKLDMAARLFDLACDHLDPKRREAIGRWFAALGRRRLRSNIAHRAIDYLARHV